MKNTLIFISLLMSLLLSNQQTKKATTAAADIDGVSYKAILNGDQSISIKAGDKTIFRAKRGDLYISVERYANMAFEDFNGDGYKDLVIAYKSTVPGKRDLALYDKRTKKFVLVPEFPGYPEPTRLANTEFYYSCHTSGCADQDWDSDIFKIVNYKIVRVGTIAGRGCEIAGDKTGIFIYRVNGKKQSAITTLGIGELAKFNKNKRSFIDSYWRENYKHF